MTLSNLDSFETLGDWFSTVREMGFNVPVQVPHAIQRAQKAWHLNRRDAFDRLQELGLLVVHEGGVIVDIRATNWDLDELVDELTDQS